MSKNLVHFFQRFFCQTRFFLRKKKQAMSTWEKFKVQQKTKHKKYKTWVKGKDESKRSLF